MLRILAGAVLFLTQAAHAQPLSREMGSMAMVGSYLGMSEFCQAYGINFSAIANRVRDGMRANALPSLSDPNRMAFDGGYRQGTHGIMYSLQSGRFINMPGSGADMRLVCQNVHQSVIQISQWK